MKELCKVATLLYNANHAKYSEDDHDVSHIPLDITSKLPQLKQCRTLSSEITSRGADLYDLLGKELQLRELRTAAISRPLDLQVIDTAVKESIRAVQENITQTVNSLENLVADGANLDSKIEKKKTELDRREKRLRSLQSVRPAFMDEFEKLEGELQIVYAKYMTKYRNLTYLEQELDEYNRSEQDKFEETEMSLKRMQTRLREEELRMLRGDKDMSHPLAASLDQAAWRTKRPNAAGRRTMGAMDGGFEDSDDSDDALETGDEEENSSPSQLENDENEEDEVPDDEVTETSSEGDTDDLGFAEMPRRNMRPSAAGSGGAGGVRPSHGNTRSGRGGGGEQRKVVGEGGGDRVEVDDEEEEEEDVEVGETEFSVEEGGREEDEENISERGGISDNDF